MYENLMDSIGFVTQYDPEIGKAMKDEHLRQKNNLELIASENIVSPAVMAAMGSILTNKYAEGYPNNRYYGGCYAVDEIEEIARKRACTLFNAEYANVQPHSGAQANQCAYFALLNPGDRVLGMNLANGGHLTHGAKVNFSGKIYDFASYGVDENGYIDYEQVRKTAKEHQPKLIVCGASAYAREIRFDLLRDIADEVGALLMADIAHIAGLVVTGNHMHPFPYCDIVTTTTHKTLRGPRGGLILAKKQYAKAIDKAVFPGSQGGPLMNVIAAKAVCFKEALSPQFKTYQSQIVKNAKALAQALMDNGIRLVSSGTDNHLMLMDLRGSGVSGKELEQRLDAIHITANKNAIPNDPLPPSITSGVRLGTPAVTSRGLMETDMPVIAECITKAVRSFDTDREAINEKVAALCKKYPLY